MRDHSYYHKAEIFTIFSYFTPLRAAQSCKTIVIIFRESLKCIAYLDSLSNDNAIFNIFVKFFIFSHNFHAFQVENRYFLLEKHGKIRY